MRCQLGGHGQDEAGPGDAQAGQGQADDEPKPRSERSTATGCGGALWTGELGGLGRGRVERD